MILFKNMHIFTRRVFAVLLLAVAFALHADNKQANEAIQSGLEKMKSADYSSAAGYFIDAKLFADETFLKAKSIKLAAEAYRKGGLKYKEFQMLEKLLSSYPTHVDYAKTVDREFELGDKFYEGERDNLFNWIPLGKDKDRTREVYEKALKRGPFARRAPDARLRLGRIYMDEYMNQEALKAFRETISMYPNTRPHKYAMLELASLLLRLSEKGDGDGKYAREAKEVLIQIKENYENDPETAWVNQALLKINDVSAERMHDLAKFYHKMGRDEPATRYLSDVVRKYPDADISDDSESLLASIDEQYKPVPADKKPPKKLKYQLYDNIQMPKTVSPIIVSPENSDGKWLLPIRDLEIGEIKKIRETEENNSNE